MTTMVGLGNDKVVRYAIFRADTAGKTHLMAAFAKTEQEWAERAARHLKAELKRAEMTYEDLAEKMKKHGFKETKASIASKLSRATVPASFFLAALVAIGCEAVTLEDI
jgi:Domain of unknown function (DUF6471)